jgi:hypothetical protein
MIMLSKKDLWGAKYREQIYCVGSGGEVFESYVCRVIFGVEFTPVVWCPLPEKEKQSDKDRV